MTLPPNISNHPTTQYALDCIEGRQIVGAPVLAACRRHLSDLDRDDIYFDIEAADRALGFFRDVLRLNGGEYEGVPFDLLGWQSFIIGSLFGWKTQDGYRRFRVAFVETAKGSGKSPLAAGIGLYMLTADDESRAEVYAAAAKHDQAKVLFRDAVAMVQQSPQLDKRLVLSGGVDKHNIAYLSKGSFFRPISSEREGRGQSGPRPHCALLDEIHEHPTNAMVEFMRAGTKGRRQALIFMITNSGSDRESVCYEYHEYAIKLSKGEEVNDSFFYYVCALDDGDDPFKSEDCWIKVNPSLGITFQPKYLREQVREARGMPSKENIVRRLNFCIWTDSETAWIDGFKWDAVQKDFDINQFKGQDAYGGLDLSKRLDLTALATVIPQGDGTYDAWVEFWTPEDTLEERREKDRVPYPLWVKKGLIRPVPGKSIHYGWVAKRIGELSKIFNYKSISYDRWKIDEFKVAMDSEGIDIELTPHGQGFKDMSPAIDKLESLIVDEMIRIKENVVLNWNSRVAMTIEDPAQGRKFDKSKSNGRIDGLVALTMAVSHTQQQEFINGEVVFF